MNLNVLDKEKENELLLSKNLDKAKTNYNLSAFYNIKEKLLRLQNAAVSESIISKKYSCN